MEPYLARPLTGPVPRATHCPLRVDTDLPCHLPLPLPPPTNSRTVVTADKSWQTGQVSRNLSYRELSINTVNRPAHTATQPPGTGTRGGASASQHSE